MEFKRFCFIFIVFCLKINLSSTNDKCILQNTKDSSKIELLNSISLLTPIRYYTAKNGYSYAVSICSDISKVNHPNASVIRTLLADDTTTVLGRHNQTDVINLGGNRILLTYAGGDFLNESIFCNNTKWKTLIFITCDYNADDINIDLLDPLNGGCFALFHLKTSISCPPRQSLFWRWFFVTILIAASYFVVGIFYKRYVEGAKGWEQVPHHHFLRNPLQHLMGCLRGKEENPIPRNVASDPADEPLLRP